MYNKVESLKKIRKLGLNIHNTIITDDLSILEDMIKKYDYVCSIRTDKEYGITKDMPFYLINGQDDYKRVKSNLALDKKEDMMFILSNGHQYDDRLIYNMVVSFEKDGKFTCEYSVKNVPLRHMYRYPRDIIYIEGNINETVASWDIKNKEHNKINIRLIGERVAQIYMETHDKGLWDRNLEISVYREKCGELNKDHVYWEV